MAESRVVTSHRTTVGDAAVAGLLHGLVAGVGMAGVLVLAGLSAGQGAARVLRNFDPAGSAPLVGMLMHLAVSGVYGLIFGLLIRLFVARGAVTAQLAIAGGLGYGILLLVISRGFMSSPAAIYLREMPSLGWACGHAVYGLFLGAMAARDLGSDGAPAES